MADEKPPIMVQRRGSFLMPEAPLDGEALQALPAGKALAITVRQPRRSSRQNRLYRGLLTVVAENLDQDITADDLHEWMKMRLGLTREVKQRNGEIVTVTRSVSFDKMEHDVFTAYFDRAKRLIVEHLIPGLNSEALEREAYAMLGEAVPANASRAA
jgi:hypothetical protein